MKLSLFELLITRPLGFIRSLNYPFYYCCKAYFNAASSKIAKIDEKTAENSADYCRASEKVRK